MNTTVKKICTTLFGCFLLSAFAVSFLFICLYLKIEYTHYDKYLYGRYSISMMMQIACALGFLVLYLISAYLFSEYKRQQRYLDSLLVLSLPLISLVCLYLLK